MKMKYKLFRRRGVFYTEDIDTGKQKSLRTRDEGEASQLLNALNEAHRQPTLNLHLARAYLTASAPAFFQRTWQDVMNQMQARNKESSRKRYTTAFKSDSFNELRSKKLLETTAADFFALFNEGKVTINLAELLDIAHKEFKSVKTIDEVDLEKGWPRLRVALGKAFIQWSKDTTPIYLTFPRPSLPTPALYHDLPLWRRRLLR